MGKKERRALKKQRRDERLSPWYGIPDPDLIVCDGCYDAQPTGTMPVDPLCWLHGIFNLCCAICGSDSAVFA